jgi:hypothetical protein
MHSSKLLYALASTMILGSESYGTHDHILLSDGSESLQTVGWLHSKVKVKIEVTLRLAVYRQTVRFGVKPLETEDQRVFFQLSTYGHSPHVTSYLAGKWVCLL